jgi:hypothetical protein
MDQEDLSVHWVFTHQVLPELFHKTSDIFLQLLEKDGNKFLHFYWDEAAKKNKLVSTSIAGMNYELRKPNEMTFIGLIILPPLNRPGESYFVAAIFRPYRVMPFGFISDISKVLLLDKAGKPGNANLIEITPKKDRVVLRQIEEVSRQRFLEEIYRELELVFPKS